MKVLVCALLLAAFVALPGCAALAPLVGLVGSDQVNDLSNLIVEQANLAATRYAETKSVGKRVDEARDNIESAIRIAERAHSEAQGKANGGAPEASAGAALLITLAAQYFQHRSRNKSRAGFGEELKQSLLAKLANPRAGAPPVPPPRSRGRS